MAALFNYPAMIHNQDILCPTNSGKPVRSNQHSSIMKAKQGAREIIIISLFTGL